MWLCICGFTRRPWSHSAVPQFSKPSQSFISSSTLQKLSGKESVDKSRSFFRLLKNIYLFVLDPVAVLGILVLQHLGTFSSCVWNFSCSIWDLVPGPGTVPRTTTLGTWNLATGPGKSWAGHMYVPGNLGNISWLCAQEEEEMALRISN